MIHKIDTIDDVITFFKELNQESVVFCPETPFEQYISLETHQATYTDEEARVRNELLEQAFNICDRDGVDIYELAMEIFLPNFDNLMAEK